MEDEEEIRSAVREARDTLDETHDLFVEVRRKLLDATKETHDIGDPILAELMRSYLSDAGKTLDRIDSAHQDSFEQMSDILWKLKEENDS